jgi:hypothetical protein
VWNKNRTARTVLAGALATVVALAVAQPAHASRLDDCRAAQDYYQNSINMLQDATYAGNIPEMGFWLGHFAYAEAELVINNC